MTSLRIGASNREPRLRELLITVPLGGGLAMLWFAAIPRYSYCYWVFFKLQPLGDIACLAIRQQGGMIRFDFIQKAGQCKCGCFVGVLKTASLHKREIYDIICEEGCLIGA